MRRSRTSRSLSASPLVAGGRIVRRMTYSLIVIVWLLWAPGEPRFYSPGAAEPLSIEECKRRGSEAVTAFSSVDGVGGAAFVCEPIGDQI